MHKTPTRMHMHDIVKIDTMVFQIVGGRGAFDTPPPPRIVNCLKYAVSDRVKCAISVHSFMKTTKINLFSCG